MKTIAEMMVHTAMCSHPEIKKVLVIDEDDYIQTELMKHDEYEKVSVKSNGDVVHAISAYEEGEFDVIIANIDLSQTDEIFKGRVVKLLSKWGVSMFKAPSFYESTLSATLTSLPETFIVAQPSFAVTEDGIVGFVFASKKYHPTADMILTKSDFLDNNDYYNTEIHKAAFDLPNQFFKSLTGYARR